MYIRLKKLRVIENNEIKNYDGYYLWGDISNYYVNSKDKNGDIVLRPNPNILPSLSELTTKNVLDNKKNVVFHINKFNKDGEESKKFNKYIQAENVIEYELY